MKETFNRWRILVASTAILLCTGAVYSFSVFAGPLSSSTGWSMSDIMLAFALAFIGLMLTIFYMKKKA